MGELSKREDDSFVTREFILRVDVKDMTETAKEAIIGVERQKHAAPVFYKEMGLIIRVVLGIGAFFMIPSMGWDPQIVKWMAGCVTLLIVPQSIFGGISLFKKS